MEQILLFSESKEIFETTQKLIGDEHKLTWCTYKCLKENTYLCSDIVIMHFDEQMTRVGTYKSIIRVKGRLGHSTPILAVIEGGTPQDIFLTLRAGAFDYLETVENSQDYKKKIEAIVLWKWYLKKYCSGVKRY